MDGDERNEECYILVGVGVEGLSSLSSFRIVNEETQLEKLLIIFKRYYYMI